MSRVIYVLDTGKKIRNVDLCIDSIRLYANRVGSDFIHKTDECTEDPTGSNKPWYWTKMFYVNTLLEKYDEVMFIDRDVLVHNDAPDLFEIFNDENKFYATRVRNEPTDDWINKILDISKYEGSWKEDDNKREYYSSGMFIVRKKLKWFFDKMEEDNPYKPIKLSPVGGSQHYVNLMFQVHNIEVDDIPYKYHYWNVNHIHEVKRTPFSHFFVGRVKRQYLITYYDMFVRELNNVEKKQLYNNFIERKTIQDIASELGLHWNSCEIGKTNMIFKSSKHLSTDYQEYKEFLEKQYPKEKCQVVILTEDGKYDIEYINKYMTPGSLLCWSKNIQLPVSEHRELDFNYIVNI
jgi:hypothetical protein